jgi:prepilin-type N-terminal cleavage/methylation domain-containing protein/prepilin-type processing-associated H-X9-DG protein
MKSNRAFTLIELLTVIAIIAILAVMTFVISGPFIRNAQAIQAMNNMKALGVGFMNYTASHDGELPGAGSPSPGFGGGTATEIEAEAWYNVVPKLAGGRGLNQFIDAKEFYKKNNLLFVPAAKYPTNPAKPIFAIAMNEKLRLEGAPDSTVRLPNFGATSSTIIFLETGIPGEKALPGQSSGAYNGGSQGSPQNVAARYRRPSNEDPVLLLDATTNLLFADGHAEGLAVKHVLNSGRAYFPQLPQNGGDGKVCWTLDPEANPN